MRSHERNESDLKVALALIKFNITRENNTQNQQLHQAVQLIVDVARDLGYLQQ